MEASTLAPAAFWRRLVALVIDTALAAFFYLVLLVPLTTIIGIRSEMNPNETRSALSMFALGAFSLTTLLLFIAMWLYSAMMESSPRKATWGKRMMRIIVTDADGGQITFGRASARFFSKIISAALVGAGFVMAPFTPRKQALHDIIAGTVVLTHVQFTPVAEPATA